jgi:hypothetical protein
MALKILRQGDAILVPQAIVEDGIVLFADIVASYKTATLTYSASVVGTITTTQGEFELNTVYDCSKSGSFELGPCASCTYEDIEDDTCQIQVDRLESDAENNTSVVTEPQDISVSVTCNLTPTVLAFPLSDIGIYLDTTFGGYGNLFSVDKCFSDLPFTFSETTVYDDFGEGTEGSITATLTGSVNVDLL